MCHVERCLVKKSNLYKSAGKCSDKTFVGEQTLRGKEAVRQYMAATYLEPPKFRVENLIAEGDFVTALGKIDLKDIAGNVTNYSYCDVWRFRDGKMTELTAFVVEITSSQISQS
jgi:ketosteroid isomerase-like protein